MVIKGFDMARERWEKARRLWIVIFLLSMVTGSFIIFAASNRVVTGWDLFGWYLTWFAFEGLLVLALVIILIGLGVSNLREMGKEGEANVGPGKEQD